MSSEPENNRSPDPVRRMTVEDRLFLVSFKPARESHLQIRDAGLCAACATRTGRERPCTAVCPAAVYEWLEDADGARLIISFENCLECGACRLACPERNIDWAYPPSGHGVTYRYG